MAELKEALALAKAAAMEAGELLLEGCEQLSQGAVRSKGFGRDLVTDLDVASERLLGLEQSVEVLSMPVSPAS